MYGVNENTQESLVSSPINAGIQDNIQITSITHEALTEGNDPLIQVTLEDEYGGVLNEVLWPVDEEQIRSFNDGTKKHKRDNEEHGFEKGAVVTPEDSVIMAYDLFNQRAKHIATKFVSEEEIVNATKGARNYQEFAEGYVSLFPQSVLSDVLLRAKIVLNNKGYSKLPKFPPFLESMKIPREKTKLRINPEYDRVSMPSEDMADDDVVTGNTELEDEPVF